MKTHLKGSIFNTLKCACGILMLFAVLLSSCDKYGDQLDDMEDNLNAITQKIPSLETLVTDISTLQTKVEAFQTAVDGDFTSLTAQITTINDELGILTTTSDASDAEILAQIASLQTSVNGN